MRKKFTTTLKDGIEKDLEVIAFHIGKSHKNDAIEFLAEEYMKKNKLKELYKRGVTE